MEINNRKIIIYWEQGHWKTMFAVFLSFAFSRVYWNINIKRNGKNITHFIKKKEQFLSFSFSPVTWVCVLDEMGINFNSKKWTSEANSILEKWFFLCRKYNISPVFVAQRFGSIPVDMRELVSTFWLVKMTKIHRRWTHPVFRCDFQLTDNEWIPFTAKTFELDLISFLKFYEVEYDTLESSLIS
jgi:hypothetical protein